MRKNKEESLREHLADLLRGGHAHVVFKDAVADLPAELRGVKPKGAPYTPWQLLEHMRIAQWDILEFSRSPRHVSPEWPGGYSPETDAPPSESDWDQSIRAFERDLRAMVRLVKSPATDLYAPIRRGDGQTILREAMLVADHNAYHLGQLVLLRRPLGAWSV